ncbi:CLUMA_CG003694, isoform A [Clunio marinus]|uniref:CLUMA_CG003694, isoform A n=1 Tax=Clunio marinus TaxID=568069 RepID=A0A1J1HTZ8_9DIPT|nr:CLUMA_CG003694, isoform A [Clunio marinus]
MTLRGWRFSEWRKYPALIPIFVCCAVSTGWALFYSLRQLTCHRDVVFDRKKNQDPWSKRDGKMLRFWYGNYDRNNQVPAPDYVNMIGDLPGTKKEKKKKLFYL